MAEQAAQATEQVQRLEAAILALEAQRGNLGDAVVDTALAPLRAQLAGLVRAAPPTAQPRLRQMTVLFADIVGSTQIVARLDAEDAAALSNDVLARFAAHVRAHQGRVLRFTGDGLKALFGADAQAEGAAESAPELAVRAGLAISDEARTQAQALRRLHGIEGFDVRVGINSGAVAMGAGVEADDTAMGAAVNLAARLEQAAAPGSVLVGAATQAQVRGLFEAEELPPLTAKGFDEPVPAWRVHAARPRAFRAANRGLAGVAAPMVGRDGELAALLAAAAESAEACGGLRAATVLAEAGVGKSRLLHELLQRLPAPGGPRLLARAEPQRRLQTYGLLREMLARHLGIADTDTAAVARERLLQGLAPLPALDAKLIGHLVGLDFPDDPELAPLLADAGLLRRRAFDATLRWLRALADGAAAPLLLVLDDIHWADQGSLVWLRHLLAEAADLPALLLMLARPSLLDAHPNWTESDAGRHRRIELAPLQPADSARLADALLARLHPVPPALRELLLRGAEGNPFYLEELVQMLIDDGVIVGETVDGQDRWRLATDRPRLAHLPPTLTAVLQARLDALPARERQALQQAALVGPQFWDGALAALDPAAPAALEELQRRRLVREQQPSSFGDCREFAFVHHLLHQVVYDTVLKAARRAGHAAAAAWLAERVRERPGEHVATTAEHYARAGERMLAARYFVQAARQASARYANDAALEHAQRALEQLGDADEPLRFEALVVREAVQDLLGDRDGQRATVEAMEAISPVDRHPVRAARVASRRAMLHDRLGEFALAFEHAGRAAELGAAQGLWDSAAFGRAERAHVLMREGRLDEARAEWALASEHAERAGDPLLRAKVLAVGAGIEEAGHQPQRALAMMQASMETAQRTGHLRLACVMQSNIAVTLEGIGDWAGAAEGFQQALAQAREIGNRTIEANALGGLATALTALGDAAAGERHVREAVDITERVGDRFSRARWLLTLGDARQAQGDAAGAEAAFAEAGGYFESAGLALERLDVKARLALLALDRGDTGRAGIEVQPLLAMDEATAADAPLRVRWAGWRWLAAVQDPRADAWLAAAQAELQARAARLDEGPVRQRFIEGIEAHRGIAAAWAARKA